MKRSGNAAAIALLLFLCSSVPAVAMPRDRRGPGDEGPIDRIIHVIKRITQPIAHVLDGIIIPRP